MKLELTFTDYDNTKDDNPTGRTVTYADVRDVRKMTKSDAMRVTDHNGWVTMYRLSHVADLRLMVTY